MITKATVYFSHQYDPYRNLAFEETLLKQVAQDEIILYLWQNQDTVVIGRNQSAWQECDVALLEKENGHIARRMSGGGAVYHDLGNVNFTFLSTCQNHDVKRQLSIIQKAVGSFGLEATFTGRNDLAIDNRKFSGNAYYSNGTASLHHGTLLIQSDFERMQRYLTPSKQKLAAKGIASVESRVANLHELASDITPESMRSALVSAFEDAYGLSASTHCLDPSLHLELEEKYKSHEWIFDRNCEFDQIIEIQGNDALYTMHLKVSHGMIDNVKVYCDAMDPQAAQILEQKLPGTPYVREAIEQILHNM